MRRYFVRWAKARTAAELRCELLKNADPKNGENGFRDRARGCVFPGFTEINTILVDLSLLPRGRPMARGGLLTHSSAPVGQSLQISTIIKGKLQQTVGPVESQFVADVLAVVVHGPDAQPQAVGNFLAGVILANEFEDPALRRR